MFIKFNIYLSLYLLVSKSMINGHSKTKLLKQLGVINLVESN